MVNFLSFSIGYPRQISFWENLCAAHTCMLSVGCATPRLRVSPLATFKKPGHRLVQSQAHSQNFQLLHNHRGDLPWQSCSKQQKSAVRSKSRTHSREPTRVWSQSLGGLASAPVASMTYPWSWLRVKTPKVPSRVLICALLLSCRPNSEHVWRCLLDLLNLLSSSLSKHRGKSSKIAGLKRSIAWWQWQLASLLQE